MRLTALALLALLAFPPGSVLAWWLSGLLASIIDPEAD